MDFDHLLSFMFLSLSSVLLLILLSSLLVFSFSLLAHKNPMSNRLVVAGDAVPTIIFPKK